MTGNRRLWPAAMVSLAVLALVAIAALPAEHWETDFLSFYAGARLAGSGALYSVRAVQAIEAPLERHPEEVRAYIRPPFYAALSWPLGKLPYRTALVIWQLVNVAALGRFIWLWSPRAFSFPLCCFCFPVWMSLVLGQDMPFFLLLTATAVYLLARHRDFAAGVVIAFCGVKFHLFLLLPVVIVARRMWRFGFGLAAGGAALLAASFAVGGWEWPRQYYELVRLNERYQASQSYMPNLNGLFHAAPHAAVWIGLCSAAVVGATWWAARRASPAAAVAIMLCGGVVISPHAFLYDLGLLLPFLLDEDRTPGRALMLSAVAGAAALALTVPAVAFLGQLAIAGLFGAAVWETRAARDGLGVTAAPAWEMG